MASGQAKNRQVSPSRLVFQHGFRNLSRWERFGLVEREGLASILLHLALAMAMATFTVFQVLSVTYSGQV